MSKSEWLELGQVAVTCLTIWGGKYIAKAQKIISEHEDNKKRIITLENSVKAAWEKIDKIKKLPHGGEI